MARYEVPVTITLSGSVTFAGAPDDISKAELKELAEEEATDLLFKLPKRLAWSSARVTASPSRARRR